MLLLMITPTEQQRAIIEAVKQGHDVVVEALAGTGKSTTLRLIAEAMPEKQFRYVVFNKSQQKEAKRKMPKNVENRTGNSLAWEFVDSVYKKYNLSLPKRYNSADGSYLSTNKEIATHFKIESYEVEKEVKSKKETFTIKEILTPAKAVGHLRKAIAKFCNSTDAELSINHFNPEYSYPASAVADARTIWADISDLYGRTKIKHEHIVKLWAKSPRDLSISLKNSEVKYDILMIDEAQDTNPVFGGVYAQQNHMQRIYVGDQNQAIYGFRGAEDELQKVDISTRLPLNESWRFGANIAGPANLFLKKLNYPLEVCGMRNELGIIIPTGTMENPDAVLCRTNAGVLKAIFERLDSGYLVSVEDKFKDSLISLLDSLAWFSGYLQEQPKIHEDLENYSSMEEIKAAIDNFEETQKIKELVSLFQERGYKELRNKLSLLDGRNRKGAVEIITAHRSKGSEWDRVQIYTDFWGYREDEETGQMIPPKDEEFRLAYVAVTRAKLELDLGSLSYITRPNHDVPRSQRRYY